MPFGRMQDINQVFQYHLKRLQMMATAMLSAVRITPRANPHHGVCAMSSNKGHSPASVSSGMTTIDEAT